MALRNAIDRRADRPTGPGDGQSAQPAPGCVKRLAECRSGSGLSAADHCRVGPTSATFPPRNVSPRGLVLPGRRRERGLNYSHRSRRATVTCGALLNQAANPSQNKGSIFEIVYRARSAPGTPSSHWDHRHRQCRLIWLILHQEFVTKERGQRSPNDRSNSAFRDASATPKPRYGSNHRILTQQHKCSDFRLLQLKDL